MTELGLDNLPPVPDLSSLKIDLSDQDCEQMGTVSSIVDRLGNVKYVFIKNII